LLKYPNSSPKLRPFLCSRNIQQTKHRTASRCGPSLVIRNRTYTIFSEGVRTAAEADVLA